THWVGHGRRAGAARSPAQRLQRFDGVDSGVSEKTQRARIGLVRSVVSRFGSSALVFALAHLSACSEEGRQECGAAWHGGNEDVFVVRMGGIANGAKAVQGGNADCARKVAIGAAARGAFAQRKMHLLCERLRVSKKRCAPLVLEGRAVEDRKSTRLNSSHLVISYAVF